MKKTIVIKRKYEFKTLYLKGKKYFSKNLTMHIRKNRYEFNRIGIAIGKKSGKAVQRNRIKRLIRENYKNFEIYTKTGYDILISVNLKSDIKNIDFYEIQNDLKKLFITAEIMDK